MSEEGRHYFRWQRGRQHTGYSKMRLLTLRWPFPFDVYILKFGEGHHVPTHTDSVTSGRHYRVNLILRHATEGGEFQCETPIYQSSRIKFFRPDTSAHSVTRVVTGSRYVLSIGWVRRRPES